MKTRIYKPLFELCKIDWSDWKKVEEAIKHNLGLLQAIDERSQKNKTILFRHFFEVVADGQVPYQIIEERRDKNGNITEVKIRHCTDIDPDNYVHPYFGHEKWIDAEYALQKIRTRDILEEIFKKK